MNAIPYSIIRRGQPGVAGGGDQKYYAFVKRDRVISLREIIEEITAMSTLTKGDALNAVENFLDLIPKYVRKGHIVNLGQLGTFRVNISSNGHEQPEKVTAYSIKGARVIFAPSAEMKMKLAELKFTRASDAFDNLDVEPNEEAA
ncbi:HU family DNA-binding protein [uncultured Imperialibacter sp.]|uniref:HU family DNA-binding protein n=1 Tax=uncultured Imperialibacter sp. TaxID=1672639 RepID=UPI0030DB6266|tara:strand:+ start:225 stop:659 length:435 start_codon:yes stop_codon:yes gene_type:complete